MKIKRERPLSAAAMGCPPVPCQAKKQGYPELVFGWQSHAAALVKLRKWLKGSWAPAGNH